jgi:hypothetical protein
MGRPMRESARNRTAMNHMDHTDAAPRGQVGRRLTNRRPGGSPGTSADVPAQPVSAEFGEDTAARRFGDRRLNHIPYA